MSTQRAQDSSNNPLKSPRPLPVLVPNNEAVLRKKQPGSRFSPPRPPVKSAPPVSRVFRNRQSSSGPVSVSFRNRRHSSPIKSPHYNSQAAALYFDQCFHVLGHLGSGSFGEAFKVQSKEDGQFYAIKRSRDKFRGLADRKWKLEEVNKHENIPPHKNCVKFIQAWEERQQLYIQTELCEMSLKDYSDQISNIPEKEIWNILVDLCLGLKHLHDNGFTHMDIKPANLFLGRDGCYKIGDFGLAVELSKQKSDVQEGDPKYLAPELMRSEFSTAADIFSLGIALLELACSVELPRGGALWHQLRRGGIPAEITQGLSSELYRVLMGMMEPNASRRMTADDIVELPVVKQLLQERQCTGFFHSIHEVLSYSISTLLYLWRAPWRLFRSFRPKNSTPVTRQPPYLRHDFDDVDDDLQSPINHSMQEEKLPVHSFCLPRQPINYHRHDSVLRDSGICNDSAITADRSHSLETSLHTPSKLTNSFNHPNAVHSSPIDNAIPPPAIHLFDAKYGLVDEQFKTSVGPKNLLCSFEEAALD